MAKKELTAKEVEERANLAAQQLTHILVNFNTDHPDPVTKKPTLVDRPSVHKRFASKIATLLSREYEVIPD